MALGTVPRDVASVSGSPGPVIRHPWSSCTIGRARQGCRGRGVRRRRRAAHVVGGQVARRMGVTLVARTPVPVLPAPRPRHSRTEMLPCSGAVESVLPAAVRLPGMLGAATAWSAGDDTADRAEQSFMDRADGRRSLARASWRRA